MWENKEPASGRIRVWQPRRERGSLVSSPEKWQGTHAPRVSSPEKWGKDGEFAGEGRQKNCELQRLTSNVAREVGGRW